MGFFYSLCEDERPESENGSKNGYEIHYELSEGPFWFDQDVEHEQPRPSRRTSMRSCDEYEK